MELQEWVNALNAEQNGGRYMTRQDFEEAIAGTDWEITDRPNSRTASLKLFYQLGNGVELIVTAMTLESIEGDRVRRGNSNKWNTIRFGARVTDNAVMVGKGAYSDKSWDEAHLAMSCFGSIKR